MSAHVSPTARLRHARSCYDHLAGRLGVAIADTLIEHGALVAADDGFALTEIGAQLFDEVGVDVERARAARRPFARACIDWTERRPHLAGSLGASVLERFLSAGWVTRSPHGRALQISALGHAEIERRFGVRLVTSDLSRR